MPAISLPRRTSRARLQPVAALSAMAFRQAVPWLLGSLVMTMFALIGQVPTWTLLAFGFCTLWRYLIARNGGPLPSMVVRLLVFMPVAAGVVMTYGTNPSAAGMLTFLIALLSLKILELRSARDFTVVSLLGYFMALSAFFYDQSLLLAVYLGVALLLNTVALIRCHSGGRRDAWPAVRLALGLFAQSLPLVVLLFVIFPRLQVNFLRRLGTGSTGQTGMNEHLQPGSFSSLVQSTDPAFRAKIGKGEILPQRQLYWRGLVLDVCESSMSWRAGGQLQMTTGAPPARSNSPRIVQQIMLYPQGERWLFALDHPVDVQPSTSLQATLFATDVLQSRTQILSKLVYYPISELDLPETPLSQGLRGYYTHVPTDLSDRVKKLAQGWKAAAHTDEDVVRSARQYFRDGGFTYTLNPGLLPLKGALDQFLFSSRRGFCEHYSAAFSTLMRIAGVPSRVVVGYQGGEFNSWGGYYLVHQSDAHAWCEVWLAGKGWQREDPTAVVAPERVSFGAENYATLGADGSLSAEARLARLSELNSPGSLRWLLHGTLLAWDGIDQQWNLFVLGYDQDKQQSALQALGLENLSWLGGTAMTLAAIATILMGGTATMRVFNRGPATSDDPVRRLYRRFCRRLAAAADVHRDDAEGPLDYARRASEVLPEQAAAIKGITDLYVVARYAPATATGHKAGGTAQAALREAVKNFHPARHKA